MSISATTLAEDHYEYALRLCGRFSRTLPSHVDRDAMRGAALEGLVKAAKSYTPNTGVPFKNWAARRVIGQMRDELRVQDHLSRRTRERLRDGEPLLVADAEAPLSLNQIVSGGQDLTVEYMDLLVATEEGLWEEETELGLDQVQALVGELPESQFRVVVMRFYEGKRVSEVAHAMGLSESRINQLETAALQSLRLQVAA